MPDIDLSAPMTAWMPVGIYVGHRTGLPDVVVGQWPAEFGRPQGQGYKSWICETPAELADVVASLGRPCPVTAGAIDLRRGPDSALAHRRARGAEPRGDLVVALYPPPASGWPWLILTSLPAPSGGYERERYAWEAMPSEAAAIEHLARLAALAREAGTVATIIIPERPQ